MLFVFANFEKMRPNVKEERALMQNDEKRTDSALELKSVGISPEEDEKAKSIGRFALVLIGAAILIGFVVGFFFFV